MRTINPDKQRFSFEIFFSFFCNSNKKIKKIFRHNASVNLWIILSVIQISSVSMVVSGHKPDLQSGNFNLVHDGHYLKNVRLKIKKINSFSSSIFCQRTPYIFITWVVFWQARRTQTRPAVWSFWRGL